MTNQSIPLSFDASTSPEFPYDRAIREDVARNLCGGVDREIVARTDRNGLDVQSVICTNCGLIYLSPRMTPDWYARYYEVEYRRQMAAFHGRKGEAEHRDSMKLFRHQQRHGRLLVDYLQRRGGAAPRSVLDVGSSAGGLLHSLQQAFGCEVLGVEPTPEDAEFARRQGVPTEIGLFEQIQLPADRRFDLVVCTQTFNHLLDPRGVAERIFNLLTPGGAFLLECQNFFDLCRFWGRLTDAVQIDHTYMFTPETLQSLLARAGFVVPIESIERDSDLPAHVLRDHRRASLPSLHVRVLARRANGAAAEVPNPYETVRGQLDSLPHAPLRRWCGRKVELQLMRWDRLKAFLRRAA